MIASRISANPFNMVDDTMEISSEHDQNAGNEDIDIDIDLTTGQADEDFVLEDATTDNFHDNGHPEPYSAPSNDDLMVDDQEEDNNAGESFVMGDVELAREDGEADTGTSEALMSLATADTPYLDDGLVNADILTKNTNLDSNQTWDQYDTVDWEVRQEENHKIRLESSEDTLLRDGGDYTQDEIHQRSNDAIKILSDQESRTITPRTGSPIMTVADQVKSPPASHSVTSADYPDRSHDGDDPSLSVEDHFEDPGDTNAVTSAGQPHHLYEDIVVVYQSVEYALFGNSDSDDPDSYFLSDLSTTWHPLSKFFGALREIIHEDIADDADLSIVIEDMGIEMQEAFASISNCTIGQLADLHEKLLVNDGIEPRPLCILLGTRPSFPKRLARLTAGIAEGKGLSELNREDQGDAFEELLDADDSNLECNTIEEDKVPNDSPGEEKKAENSGGYDAKDDRLQQTTNENHAIAHVPDCASENGQSASKPEFTSTTVEESPAQQSDLQAQPKTPTGFRSDVDEDGDLIDYSDEEDSGEQRSSENFRQAENHIPSKESETRNEEPRNQQNSRDTKRGVENDQENTYASSNVDEESAAYVESEIEYDENPEDVPEDNTQSQEPKSPLVENETTTQENDVHPKGHLGDSSLADSDAVYTQPSASIGDNLQADYETSVYEQGTAGLDDIFDDDPSKQTYDADPTNDENLLRPEIVSYPNEKVQNVELSRSNEEMDANELDFFEDSETIDGPNLLTENGENSAELTHGDEIDYDDNDDVKELDIPDAVDVLEPKTSTPDIIGVSVKRSRIDDDTDLDADDASLARSKDAKRPRS